MEEELAELKELIVHAEEFIPTVPDALTDSYLKSAGLANTDPKIVRILSLITQKFIADISQDALKHCKIRTANSQLASSYDSNKDKKEVTNRGYTMTMEDLTSALAERNITTIQKPQYFS